MLIHISMSLKSKKAVIFGLVLAVIIGVVLWYFFRVSGPVADLAVGDNSYASLHNKWTTGMNPEEVKKTAEAAFLGDVSGLLPSALGECSERALGEEFAKKENATGVTIKWINIISQACGPGSPVTFEIEVVPEEGIDCQAIITDQDVHMTGCGRPPLPVEE